MTTAVKGLDTQIKVMVDTKLVAEFDLVLDFEITEDGELIEDEYLGKPTKTFDQVFHGYKFKFSTHLSDPTVEETSENLSKQMRYESGGTTRIDILRIVRYPTGQVRTWTYMDCKFGPRTSNTGSRTDRTKFDWEGATDTIVLEAD